MLYFFGLANGLVSLRPSPDPFHSQLSVSCPATGSANLHLIRQCHATYRAITDHFGIDSQSVRPVLRIRIRRIRMFLGLLDPDPDPLVRCTDPDPSIIKQK